MPSGFRLERLMANSVEMKMRTTTVTESTRYNGDVGGVSVDVVGEGEGDVNCIVIWCVVNWVVYHT